MTRPGLPARGRRRINPEEGTPEYRQVWRVVDGAVRSAFDAHPDYVPTGKRLRTVRNSIVKRVTGALIGYAEGSAQGRPGSSPAVDSPERQVPVRLLGSVGPAKGQHGGAGSDTCSPLCSLPDAAE